MKNLSTFFLIVLLSMVAGKASAYDAEIDGVCYNFINEDEAEIARDNYTGTIKIPANIVFDGKTYTVTTIGEKAFAYRQVELTLPNTIVTIKKDAFQGSNMVSLAIPSSVKSIENGAFGWWNPVYDDQGNQLNKIPKIIIKDLSAWTKVEMESALFTPTSPDNGGWALYSDEKTKITDLTIPEGADMIRDYAFSGCVSITSVTIPNSVKAIGKQAFKGCVNLKTATIGDGVTSIGERAFYVGDSNSFKDFGLLSVAFGKNVKEIGEWAFAYNKLTSLTLPEKLEIIGNYAFNNCGTLLSLVIPNSVTTIGNSAFSQTKDNKFLNFQSVKVGSGVLEMGGNAFCSQPRKVIWMPNTPPKGYDYNTGIVNYVSSDSYKKYFEKYPLLSSMFEVDGVKYVPLSMSERTCEAIDAVYDESAALTKIGTKVTYRGITFTMKYVRPYTCIGNTFVDNVELTDLPFIEDHVFDGCTNLQRVKLPETVAWLGFASFKDCSTLKDITIPSATTEIKHNAFKGCSSLQNITMNDGSEGLTLRYNIDSQHLSYIAGVKGTPLFEDCPLYKVYIGRNITYGTKANEGYSPFYRNTSLRSVEITDQETEIGENEFYGCSGLKKVKIGDGVTTFGNWAFSGCSSLDYFEFGSSVKTIGKEAFSDCSAVTNVISHTAVPPTCGSQAMDDISKWDCTLTVPDGTIDAYAHADQWKEFLFAQEYSAYLAGVDDIRADSKDCRQKVFSLSGQRLTAPRKGLNIIGGRKVIVK